ncbi:MAG: hypothetical protein CML56_01700 [Rhodobacteraceae bacterium]|nr:hypothetical protein [Paracoccaceae bacterium]
MIRSILFYFVLFISFLFASDPALKNVANEIQNTSSSPAHQKLKIENQEKTAVAKEKHEKLKQSLNAKLKDVRKRYSLQKKEGTYLNTSSQSSPKNINLKMKKNLQQIRKDALKSKEKNSSISDVQSQNQIEVILPHQLSSDANILPANKLLGSKEEIIRPFQSSIKPEDRRIVVSSEHRDGVAGDVPLEFLLRSSIKPKIELNSLNASRNRTIARVAILQSNNNQETVAAMANALITEDYEAVPVNPEDIDQLDEALYFDAFIIGGSGNNNDEVMWAEVYEVIYACVNEYGRGLVHTGWGMYSINSGSDSYGFLSDMLPLYPSYNYHSGEGNSLTEINVDSPLMDGVSSDWYGAFAEYSNAGMKEGAEAHALYTVGSEAVVSWDFGEGRVVNLGHIYMANYSYQQDHLIVTEGSFNLLKNSINWSCELTNNDNDDDEEDETGNISGVVLDQNGNVVDTAMVYFWSVEHDSTLTVEVNEQGVFSVDLIVGPWSVYAMSSDTTQWWDFDDIGVVFVAPGSEHTSELTMTSAEEYAMILPFASEVFEDGYTNNLPMANIWVENSAGEEIYNGFTNVWGYNNVPVTPGEDYVVHMESHLGYEQRNVFVDADAVGTLVFEFFQFENSSNENGGTEMYYMTVADMYSDHETVLASYGNDCIGCEGNLSEMVPDESVNIASQEDFDAWSSTYQFMDYYFQFIDDNQNQMYDAGEIYAVSCEEGSQGNMTVAYNGDVYWMDFLDFWMQAYDFEFYPNDGGDDDEFTFLGNFEGRDYVLSSFGVTWHDALNFADTVDAGDETSVYMATITSQEENDFIQQSLYSMTSEEAVWIGLTDEYEEGNWQWVTGEDVTYTNWAEGEPNNAGDTEHYGEFNIVDGLWNDVPGDYSIPFIVEVEFNNPDSGVYFTKEDYADVTDPANWDHITGSVAITRGDNQGLFNPYIEDSYNGSGPSGTLWSPMPTDQSTTADYVEWVEAVNYSPPSVLGQTISLWCVEENFFYDIQMESWTAGNNGGGFSYWRYPAEAPPEPGMILVWTGVGNDSTGDGSFDSPFATIGHAFNEMNDGDMILVGPGVYNENISASNTSGMLFSFAGSDSTVINGNGQGTIFEIIQGDWIVRGFAFTNGSADVNGGALYINNGTIMLGNNIFVSNTAESEGGALFATNSDVIIDSCMFLNNSTNSFDGGAMKVSSYDSLSNRFVSISNTLFTGNSARAGAGAYIGASDGAYMDVFMDRVTFVQNSGDYNVGLRVHGNTYTSVYNSAFIGNESQGHAAAGGFSQGSGGYMDHCLIVNNHANLAGGNANSGGFSVWSGSNVYFNFCTFAGNIAAYGSALSVGGGSYADVHGSIVWGNPGQNSLAAVQWDNNGSGLHLHETTLQGGENGVFTDTLSYAEYSNVMSSPPFFCEPANGNFSIDEMSPAVTSWGEPMGALGYGCTGTIQADATILSIEDIPNDQGGRVYITFERSIFDTDGLGRTEMYTIERLDGDQWVGLNSVGAYASNVYVVEATTLADSTSENDAMTTYRVVANMDEGNFESEPLSGYSVDNIFPGMLTGLNAVLLDGVVNLNWEMSDANDLSHYNIYRSHIPDLNIDETYLIGESNDPAFSDDITELGEYYYTVTAVDIHENEGDPSEVVNIALLSLEDIHGLPQDFAIHQNYPNPFNPTTTLRYDIPESGTVSILIYDMMGRQIRSLVNQNVSAGYHFVQWDGTNDTGSLVAAGVYIYSLNSGSFRGIKKMILLK